MGRGSAAAPAPGSPSSLGKGVQDHDDVGRSRSPPRCRSWGGSEQACVLGLGQLGVRGGLETLRLQRQCLQCVENLFELLRADTAPSSAARCRMASSDIAVMLLLFSSRPVWPRSSGRTAIGLRLGDRLARGFASDGAFGDAQQSSYGLGVDHSLWPYSLPRRRWLCIFMSVRGHGKHHENSFRSQSLQQAASRSWLPRVCRSLSISGVAAGVAGRICERPQRVQPRVT